MTLITSEWYRQPVSRRLRMRRSTAILLALFLGLGAVYLATRPDPEPASAPSSLTSAMLSGGPDDRPIRWGHTRD